MNRNILNQDICDFVDRCGYWDSFKAKKVLITGATGLIGSILVKCLLALDKKHQLGMQITCVVRNVSKAKMLFQRDTLTFVSFNELSSMKDAKIDYIIHAAAPTTSSFMVSNPVETMDGIVGLTKNILEYSKEVSPASIVYLSSLESYGEILDDEQAVTEDMQAYINPLCARSSYSMGKRSAECLCFAYFSEYKLPVKIARLGQTFGAGVPDSDNRVFAYIAKCAMKHKNVVLSTTGESRKNYCYTIDAVDGILRILLMGKDGEAYNIANEQTYISVKDMAYQVLARFSKDNLVVCECKPDAKYPPTTRIRMDVSKLKELGWIPSYGLLDMFDRLILSYGKYDDVEGNL